MSETRENEAAAREFRYTCTSCQVEFVPVVHRKTKWAVAAAGGVLGAVLTENLLAGAAVGVLCYLAAAAADRFHFSMLCPECGSIGRWMKPVEEAGEEPDIVMGNEHAPATH
jgi:hypothetical protein